MFTLELQINLQPISSGQRLQFSALCKNCSGKVNSGTGFADLDAPFGTYLCIKCVTAYHMPASRAGDMIVAMERTDLQRQWKL